MSKTRLRTLRRAWQVAMGGMDGIPRPHFRRIKKNWRQVKAGRGWTPLQFVKKEAVVTAAGKMGAAIGLARRGRGVVDDLWRQMRRQEELRKEGKA